MNIYIIVNITPLSHPDGYHVLFYCFVLFLRQISKNEDLPF